MQQQTAPFGATHVCTAAVTQIKAVLIAQSAQKLPLSAAHQIPLNAPSKACEVTVSMHSKLMSVGKKLFRKLSWSGMHCFNVRSSKSNGWKYLCQLAVKPKAGSWTMSDSRFCQCKNNISQYTNDVWPQRSSRSVYVLTGNCLWFCNCSQKITE